jgi:Ca2+-binding EF-hand superfamily protein
MFRQMKINISREECKEIFDSIDLDCSESIDWPEF